MTGEDAKRWCSPMTTVPPGWGTHCLATDKVRFVGEPVAAVAAVSRYVAEDALELIGVDYEPLPPVVDADEGARAGQRRCVFDEHGTNVMLQTRLHLGRRGRRVRRRRPRRSPSASAGTASAPTRSRRSASSASGIRVEGEPHLPRQLPGAGAHGAGARACVFGLPSNKVRVISHPHGGSFGGKGGARGTDITALLSRKCGGRPVKWIEDRMEYLAGGASQAWDRHYEASLALDRRTARSPGSR